MSKSKQMNIRKTKLSKVFLTILITQYIFIQTLVAGGSGTGTSTSTGTGSSKNHSANSMQATTKSTSTGISVRTYVDKDKDGKISQFEIMSAIDEYFEGNSPYKIEEIQGLVDTFFDE